MIEHTIRCLCIIVLLTLCGPAMVTANDPAVDDLKVLGRSALIEMAVEEVENSGHFEGFDRGVFDRVTVFTDGLYLWVVFDMSVRFVPWDTRSLYTFTVFLSGQQECSYSSLASPDSMPETIPVRVFRHTPESTAELDRVLDRLGYTLPLPADLTLTIIQDRRHYYVEEESTYFFNSCRVNRRTLRINDAVHESLAVPEDDVITIIED